MAISIHSNRFAAGYHNMSAPPRTKVDLKRAPVSGQVVIFSFTWALWKSPHFEQTIRKRLLSSEDRFMGRKRHFEGDDAIDHVHLTTFLPKEYKDPNEIFSLIGDPVFPEWEIDFLIGFRELNSTFERTPRLCEDPLLCAGVLSRTIGTLYLSRREPELSWERLLNLPVAFDDRAIKI